MIPLHAPNRFVGRHRDLVALSELLSTQTRIVTITGPEGIGKSRLSSEHLALTGSERWVVGVDLTEASSEADVLALVGSALGTPATSDREPLHALADTLKERGPCTILLDHADAARDHVRMLCATLLARAPEAAFLVTATAKLGLLDEHVIELKPFDVRLRQELPTPDVLRLWHIRKTGELPKTPPRLDAELTRLLHMLGGVPLAVEIVAAAAAKLTPSALLERIEPKLRGKPVPLSNEDVLEAALDVAFELCPEAERAAFIQCGAFAGGFDLEAAAEVIVLPQGKTGRDAVVPVIERLVSRCLLEPMRSNDDSERLGLHPSLRAYARKKLITLEPDGVTRRRHAAHYTERLHRLADALEGPTGPACLREIVREQDNLMAVIASKVLSQPTAENLTLRLKALSIRDHVLSTFGPAEADLTRLDLCLDAPESKDVVPSALTEALCVRSFVRARLRRFDGALEDTARALDVAEKHGITQTYDGGRIAVTRSFICLMSGQLDEAGTWAERSTETAKAIGHRRLEGIAIGTSGIIARARGELDVARSLYERALAVHEEVGNLRFTGIVEARLALLALEQGAIEEAQTRATRALPLQRTFADRLMEGLCLTVMGVTELAHGALEPGRVSLEAAIPLLDAVGERRRAAIARAKLVRVRAELGDFPLARSLASSAAEGFRTIESAEDECLLTSFEGVLRSLAGEAAEGRALLETAQIGSREFDPIVHALLTLDRTLLDLTEVRELRGRGELREAEAALLRIRTRVREAQTSLVGADGPPMKKLEAALASRFADALLLAHEQSGTDRVLSLPPHAKFFVAPNGTKTDCSSRPAMRRILARLSFQARAHPSRACSDRALFAAGWPNEHPGEETARLQLYAVIGSLRKLGLGDHLRATDEGHALDPALPIVLTE